MIFLTAGDVVAIHDHAIERYGGETGMLDDGALASALVAAENRQWYEGAGPAACAATYLWHLVHAHAFVDGNKRVAAAAAETFLVANGATLDATDDDYHDVVVGIAGGRLSRADVDAWMSDHVRAA